MRGELIAKSVQEGIAKQLASVRRRVGLIGSTQTRNGLVQIALVQQDFSLQGQGFRILGVSGQPPIGLAADGIELIEHLQAFDALRKDLSLVADQIARDKSLARLGNMDRLSLDQVHGNHFAGGQRHEISIAAEEPATAGHGPFGQGDRSSVPGRLGDRGGHLAPNRLESVARSGNHIDRFGFLGRLFKLDRPKLFAAREDDFALVNARHVKIVLALAFPQKLARGQLQAMQRIGLDRRDQDPTVGHHGHAVGPPWRRIPAGVHSAGKTQQSELIGFVGASVTVSPEQGSGSQLDRHDRSGRRRTYQHAVGV